MSKKQKKENPQCVKDLGYMIHDYVRRGLPHLEDIKTKTKEVEKYLVDNNDEIDEIDFGFAYEIIANAEASFHALSRGHSQGSKLTQSLGYPKINAKKDWLDADGKPKGVGRR